mmetsp:Transcript_22356/g.33028  ORF Transcript_22356/g.33028 Transcript_22356/m.33028 type:complete len:337 (+) Transcript_22356:71-1081(+)|eukprot:CAMPEP_0194201248 /NCGR_PEP_ID=MMETSP0156-20130528/1554_1 /TAXON_ID=33649 /ORGANISM="Thalassionema nitzschioides, Strain L26-B" /LENGTH=336 /DNA_ID=CAMNT_0038926381 /DNA_START=44 /DNA_END=1054 /DNA_ORIENTATION=-
MTMIFRTLTFSAFLVASSADIPCPVIPADNCNACGEGKCITKPDEIFSFPGYPATPCGVFEDTATITAIIPLGTCGILPSLISVACGCATSKPDTPAPTAAPVSPPTRAPVLPTSAPTDAPTTSSPVEPAEPEPVDSCPDLPGGDDNPGCSVCGPNKEVSNPGTIFDFPGQPIVNCEGLQLAGAIGLITVDECIPAFFELVAGKCGCKSCIGDDPDDETTTDAPTNEPTAAPTNEPTSAPTAAPTAVPTNEPTPAPVPPTPAPLVIFTNAPLPASEQTFAPVKIIDDGADDGGKDAKKGSKPKGMGGTKDDNENSGKNKADRRRRLVTQPSGVRGH